MSGELRKVYTDVITRVCYPNITVGVGVALLLPVAVGALFGGKKGAAAGLAAGMYLTFPWGAPTTPPVDPGVKAEEE